MANHQARSTPNPGRTLEETAALLVKASQDRDRALSNCSSLQSQHDALAERVRELTAERDGLVAGASDRDKISAAALADANTRISALEQEAGYGNGPTTTWLALVRVGEYDFRVLRLTTNGVPPRAVMGESSLDHVEAEERFRVAAADLFEQAEGSAA